MRFPHAKTAADLYSIGVQVGARYFATNSRFRCQFVNRQRGENRALVAANWIFAQQFTASLRYLFGLYRTPFGVLSVRN